MFILWEEYLFSSPIARKICSVFGPSGTPVPTVRFLFLFFAYRKRKLILFSFCKHLSDTCVPTSVIFIRKRFERTLFSKVFARLFQKEAQWRARSPPRRPQTAKLSPRRFFLIAFSLRLFPPKKKRLRCEGVRCEGCDARELFRKSSLTLPQKLLRTGFCASLFASLNWFIFLFVNTCRTLAYRQVLFFCGIVWNPILQTKNGRIWSSRLAILFTQARYALRKASFFPEYIRAWSFFYTE